MKLKMDDIARMAHVSKSAVSIAINGKEGISEDTRQKILNIISEYGYTPLRKSRKVHKKGIGEITFLVVTSSGAVQNDYRSLPFFSSLISALSASTSKLEGSLRTVTIQSNELEEKIREVKENSNNGVLVLGTDLDKEQVALIERNLTDVVFLDTYYKDIVADFVTMDNYQGAKMAGEYIISKNYERVGYFASNKLMSNFNERRRGFRDALLEKNLHVDEKYFYYISPTGLEPHDIDIDRLIQDPPQAIFCEDDYIAIRLIKALQQQSNLIVPKDIAIIGFDDIYESSLITPELTTVHVPIEQIALQALHQLYEKSKNEEWVPQKTLVSTKLIKRKSL